MFIKRCKCGATPVLKHGQKGHVHTVQLKCACGDEGALLMYTKPKDLKNLEQAAVDGWNLSD